MLQRVLLTILLLAAFPIWAQIDTNTIGTGTGLSGSGMSTPPLVSGESYPGTYGEGERSNYLRGGLIFSTAYSDNVSGGANPTSDISYSVWPTIAIDKETPRLRLDFTYSPGFTLYQRDNSLDAANQSVAVDSSYRLSPHVTLSARDRFSKLTNLFSQPDAFANTPVSGGAQSPTVAVIAPTANELTNNANAELTYQFSANSMVGISGSATNLHFLNSSQAPGLSDSNSAKGSAFYNHRLAGRHYVGADYEYSRFVSYFNGSNETRTQAIFLFYTLYLKSKLSLSVSGGAQHTDTAQAPLPDSRSWSPANTASLGWQARRTNLAASYSRIVTGGGGLVGAFHSNNASASVRQLLTRNWNIGANGNYSIYKNVTPAFLLATPGGHTISGTATVERRIGEHFVADLRYTRLHQNYSGIPLIANAPNTNVESISISYQFVRALGR